MLALVNRPAVPQSVTYAVMSTLRFVDAQAEGTMLPSTQTGLTRPASR